MNNYLKKYRSKLFYEKDLVLFSFFYNTPGIIGWTNGSFDILHASHLEYLSKCKEYCDKLIIGINSDISVKKIKGDDRPIIDEFNRAVLIASFEFVDQIIIFNDPSPYNIIKELKPNVYIKGGDYNINSINQDERKLIESYNGKIVLIPSLDNTMSSTKIINKIKGI